MIPESVLIVSFDALAEEISQRRARHPKAEEVLVVGSRDRAQKFLDDLAGRVRVRQRWYTNGSWRLDTDEDVTIRHVSASPRSLRGRSVDLVIILNEENVPESIFGDAALCVLSRRGRVVVCP